jgi:hypothetical protein
MNETVLSRLAGLKKASTTELRDLWTRYFDSEAPGYNRRFLESRIAYRIQELALGTLSRPTVARLEALGEELDGGKKAVREVSVRGRLVTGTQIVREYQGVEHRVTVLEDGFEYAGKPYRSLSAIARTITGTRWNGLVFFGLKRSGEQA